MSTQIGPGPLFEPAALGNTVSTYYTVASSPASLTLYAARVRFTNTAAATRTVTLYAVPNAGTAGTANTVVSAKAIASHDFLDVDVPMMGPGDSIQALADTGAVVVISCLAGIVFA